MEKFKCKVSKEQLDAGMGFWYRASIADLRNFIAELYARMRALEQCAHLWMWDHKVNGAIICDRCMKCGVTEHPDKHPHAMRCWPEAQKPVPDDGIISFKTEAGVIPEIRKTSTGPNGWDHWQLLPVVLTDGLVQSPWFCCRCDREIFGMKAYHLCQTPAFFRKIPGNLISVSVHHEERKAERRGFSPQLVSMPVYSADGKGRDGYNRNGCRGLFFDSRANERRSAAR